MNTNPVAKAAEIVGGQSTLARLLGVKPQAVQKWCATGKVPPLRALAVEAACNGQITRHELRPDMYPLEKAT